MVTHALIGDVQEAVGIGLQIGHTGRRREALSNIGDGLAGVRGERRDIDQRGHFVVGAGFGDHRTSPGVANQHDLAWLGVDRAARGGHVVGQRGQWILHSDDRHTLLLQQRNDLAPI
ncbi:hypothetical protein D9M68_861010 [compost metagenome]